MMRPSEINTLYINLRKCHHLIIHQWYQMMTCRDIPLIYYTAGDRFSWPIVNAVWDVFTISCFIAPPHKSTNNSKTYYITSNCINQYHCHYFHCHFLNYQSSSSSIVTKVFNVFPSGVQLVCNASSLT